MISNYKNSRRLLLVVLFFVSFLYFQKVEAGYYNICPANVQNTGSIYQTARCSFSVSPNNHITRIDGDYFVSGAAAGGQGSFVLCGGPWDGSSTQCKSQPYSGMGYTNGSDYLVPPINIGTPWEWADLTVSALQTVQATGYLSVTEQADPPPPTAWIHCNGLETACPTSGGYAYNSSVNLDWGSTDANSCSIPGVVGPGISNNGSYSTGPLTSNKTYTVTCLGNGGSASASVTVKINPPGPPTCTDPSASNYGAAAVCIYPISGTLQAAVTVVNQPCQIVLDYTTTGATSFKITRNGGTIYGPSSTNVPAGTVVDTGVFAGNYLYDIYGSNNGNNYLFLNTANASCTAAGSPPPQNTHFACQSNACVQVAGSGANTCNHNSDCVPVAPPANNTHLECQNNACVQMAGTGSNTCQSNSNCITPQQPPPTTEPSGSCQDNAQVTCSGPATLNPGQVGTFTVNVVNNGNTWWYHGNYYQLIQASSLNIYPDYGHYTPSMHTGDSKGFSFSLTAPTTPGSYAFRVQNVHKPPANYLRDNSSSCAPAPSQDTYFGQQGVCNFTVAAVPALTPSIDIKTDGVSVDYLNAVYDSYHILSWTSSNVTSCIMYGNGAANGWTGTQQPNIDYGPAQVPAIFRVDCTGPNGPASDSVTINVKPTVDLLANNLQGPLTVPYDSYHKLSWSSVNATYCELFGNNAPSGWIGTQQPNPPGIDYGPAQIDVTFKVVCTGPGGEATDTVIINPTVPNNSQCISQTVNGSVNPSTLTLSSGQSFASSIQVKNTGGTTWTPWNGSSGYNLGSQNPQDNMTWGVGRAFLSTTVPPDQQGTFNFNAIAPTTPGTYNFQWRMVQEGVEWFGPLCNNVSITVTAVPTVDLKGWGLPTAPQASPIDGTVAMTYNTSGGLVWTATNATSCSIYRDGGPIPVVILPYPGSTTAGVGPLTVAQTHSIICTGPGGASNQDSVAHTVVYPMPPPPGSPTYSDPDFCLNSLGGYVTWSYLDGNSPQSAYEVQITNIGNFNNPFYDSGQINSLSHVFSIPNGVLTWDVTYKARVRVWNSVGGVSDWSNPTNTWKTVKNAYPAVRPPYQFTWAPSNPSQSKPVQFTDHTLFSDGGGNRNWSWNFGDGGTSTQQSPAHTYVGTGNYTITETVTDATNQTCSYQQSVNVQKPIPSIKEVAPK